MFDQAEALRALVKDRVMCTQNIRESHCGYTIAVTSGKGGVGKTSISVNIALLLSRAGYNVRLIDADFGLSNAEVLLGVTPKYSLYDVIRGHIDIRDAWVDAPGGIKLLSSGSGLEEMANIEGAIGSELIDYVMKSAYDGDVVVIDTAPGIDDSVVSLLSFADEVMIVTTPEPTSITDSYAAMKVLMNRKGETDITLIANCCSNPSQAAGVAKGLDSICGRFLGRSFQRYEYLPEDSAVSRAIKAQKPLAISNPTSIDPWLRKIVIKLEDRIQRHVSTNKVPELVGV